VRVAAVVLLDGGLVLVRHRKGGRSYHLLPGGGVEAGESLGDALIREVAEETGLTIRVGRPLLLSDSIDPEGGRHVVNIVFEAEDVAGTPRSTSLDDRIEGVEVVSPADLVGLDLRPPMVADLLAALDAGAAAHAAYLGPLWFDDSDS